MRILLDENDERDLLVELRELAEEFPAGSNQYKVLGNLCAYLSHIQENEIDLLEDLSDSSAPMMAASLRAVGFIGNTASEDNIATLILHSAEMAWVINRETAKLN